VPHFDATSAECLVFTYKEGLLSAVAHDLEIRVQRLDVDVDDATLAVRARFDAASLKVVAAVRDGAPQPGALGDADRLKIEQSIREDVLHSREHPEIRFVSTAVTREGERVHITGDLTLHGKTRPLTLAARALGDRIVAEARLHQPDFAIKPYSAMLGTLKIKPDVLVRCSLPRTSLPVLG
jgi:polyisoprenoid-binding protein YceI